MLTPSFYPIKGGAETVVCNLSTKLNEIGIETDIMTFNMNRKWHPLWNGQDERFNNISIMKIPAFNWLPLRHSPRITMGVNLVPGPFRKRLISFDVLHFHGGDDLTFPFFSLFLNKPKVFQSHGFSVALYKRHFLSRLILTNIADRYLSISRQMQQDLRELGIRREKIEFLPNGVDTTTFTPLGEKTRDLVLYVGRITFDKGIHILLKSLLHIKSRIHLVLIGSHNPNFDAGYFRMVLKTIDAENRKQFHRITYLGELEQAEIVSWYRRASVFVLPSLREAFPMTILEALSCGTPVVSTNVGGIPEVVKPGQNGILVHPNNPLELAAGIEYLLGDVAVSKQYGSAGMNYVREHFSLERVVERLVGIYSELLN